MDYRIWFRWWLWWNGGIVEYAVIYAINEDAAIHSAWERACEYYESYVGMHGHSDIDEIMEEEGVDEEVAWEIFNDERENWLDYEIFPYTEEKVKELIDEGFYVNE